MIGFLNFLIVVSVLSVFIILVAGLINTAKSDNDSSYKINKFMRYRVYFQFVAVIILIISIYLKKNIVG